MIEVSVGQSQRERGDSGKVTREPQTEQEIKKIPIEIDLPEQMGPGIYANLVRIQFTQHEFLITFARLIPEDISEEQAVAKAVARIVVPHHLMPSIIEAFSDNLAKFRAMLEKQSGVGV